MNPQGLIRAPKDLLRPSLQSPQRLQETSSEETFKASEIPETLTDPYSALDTSRNSKNFEGLPLTLWTSEKFKSHFSSKSEKWQGLRRLFRNSKEPKEILSITKNLGQSSQDLQKTSRKSLGFPSVFQGLLVTLKKSIERLTESLRNFRNCMVFQGPLETTYIRLLRIPRVQEPPGTSRDSQGLKRNPQKDSQNL